MASNLIFTKDKNIGILALNREDRLNALNKDLYQALDATIDLAASDKSLKAVIITGKGKAFCVGADLKERQGMNEKDTLTRLEWVNRIFAKMEKLPVPVVAAINGTALGGGLELALACDFRISAEGALLGFPEVDLAIIPGTGGTQRLSRLVGMGRALDLILNARKVTSDQALVLGFVNQVCRAENVVEVSKEYLGKMLAAGPLAIAAAKRAIREGFNLKLPDAIALELESYKTCLYSKDRLEGLKAFSEKRPPQYRGE